MRLYWHYKNRFLPNTGGIADQANYYIEAMEIIDKTFADIELAKAERERRRAEQ